MASGNSKPLYLYKTYTYSGPSLSPKGNKTVTATNFNYSIPSGYTPLGVMGAATGSSYLTIRTIHLTADNMMTIYNYFSDTVSSGYTVTLQVMFVLSTHKE